MKKQATPRKSAAPKKSQSAEDRLSKLKADQIILKQNLGKNIYADAAESKSRKLGTMLGDGATLLGELMTGNLQSLGTGEKRGDPAARRRRYAERQDSQAGQRISDRSKVIGRLSAQIARKKRKKK